MLQWKLIHEELRHRGSLNQISADVKWTTHNHFAPEIERYFRTSVTEQKVFWTEIRCCQLCTAVHDEQSREKHRMFHDVTNSSIKEEYFQWKQRRYVRSRRTRFGFFYQEGCEPHWKASTRQHRRLEWPSHVFFSSLVYSLEVKYEIRLKHLEHTELLSNVMPSCIRKFKQENHQIVWLTLTHRSIWSCFASIIAKPLEVLNRRSPNGPDPCAHFPLTSIFPKNVMRFSSRVFFSCSDWSQRKPDAHTLIVENNLLSLFQPLKWQEISKYLDTDKLNRLAIEKSFQSNYRRRCSRKRWL